MKIIKVTLIILITASILVFVKSGMVFHIAKVLPFCSGNPIEMGYELGGLAILVLFFLGLRRLHRNRRNDG